jgi:GAG-pre-integrase domain/gag-polypeptide of LTR copia-type
MVEDTTLKSHISKYTVLLNDMEMICIKTDDEDKVMLLLCSLSNSYKGFKETILHSRDSLTLEDVKNNLLIKSDIDLDSRKATNHGIIRTLTGVRHIPDLTKNLISLGSLEDAGCKFQSDGGVLKVLKCALTFMKVKKVSTLYFLEGISIVGTAVIVNSTSGSDNTKSWHMRLGHMSERGMTLLSKEYMLCGQSIGKLNIYEDCVFGKQKRDSILHLF